MHFYNAHTQASPLCHYFVIILLPLCQKNVSINVPKYLSKKTKEIERKVSKATFVENRNQNWNGK